MILGGLGVVLGTLGLGALVLRNVLERRSELALLRAVGYSRKALRSMVLGEHWLLLALGLLLGSVSALVAVSPTPCRPRYARARCCNPESIGYTRRGRSPLRDGRDKVGAFWPIAVCIARRVASRKPFSAAPIDGWA